MATHKKKKKSTLGSHPTSETVGVGPSTLFQQGRQGILMPATVLEPLLSSYNITSFPKGFLAPLLPHVITYDSSGLPVKRTDSPGLPVTVSVLPLKVSYSINLLVLGQ